MKLIDVNIEPQTANSENSWSPEKLPEELFKVWNCSKLWGKNEQTLGTTIRLRTM